MDVQSEPVLVETLSFLMTDVVGSSAHWEREPIRMHQVFAVYDELVAQVIQARAGRLIRERGEGDSHFAVFRSPLAAIMAGVDLQARLREDPPCEGFEVRAAVVTGEVRSHGVSYYGPILNRCARIRDITNAGQVLVSQTAYQLIRWDPEELEMVSLGVHKLRDIVEPDELCQASRPGHGREFPALRSVSSPVHNFLEDERPFVGRQVELRDLGRHIADPRYRLITLSGMGGIGKSRLSRQAALEQVDRFHDGLYLVECENLKGAELISAIAAAMQIDGDVRSVEELAARITDCQALIILDCFEGLIEERLAVETLVRKTKQPKILITSRASLGLPREVEYRLGPMVVESKANKPSDAVELLWEAAMHVSADLKRTKQLEANAGKIVESLEGVPLAIVLAASRLRHMTLQELLDQIRINRLQVLKRRPIGRDDRHQDLARVIGDSFDLLPESERRLMFDLTVFRGFYMEDAVAVLGNTLDVRDGIANLRDNSLLVCQTVGTRTRFRILDSVREYIAAESKGVISDSIRRAHATHYASVASEMTLKAQSGDWRSANSAMWMEMGNLRDAIHTAKEEALAEPMESLARALARPLAEAGMTAEFDNIVQGLNACGMGVRGEVAIEIAGLQGMLAKRSGNLEEALRLWNRQADLWRDEGMLERQADTLTDICDTALRAEMLEEATAALKDLAQIDHPCVNEGPVFGACCVLHGQIEIARGNPDSARPYLDRALQMASTAKRDHRLLYVLYGSAEISRALGQHDSAQRLFIETMAIAAEGGYYPAVWRLLIKLIGYAKEERNTRRLGMYLELAKRLPKAASHDVRQSILQELKEFERPGASRIPAKTLSEQQAPWLDLIEQLSKESAEDEIRPAEKTSLL
jgi:predicted ATPase/class 3 adenylate cyclase